MRETERATHMQKQNCARLHTRYVADPSHLPPRALVPRRCMENDERGFITYLYVRMCCAVQCMCVLRNTYLGEFADCKFTCFAFV